MFKVGDRVKLVQLSANKNLIGFKIGDVGRVIETNYPVNGYTLIKWQNGKITDSNNKYIEKI